MSNQFCQSLQRCVYGWVTECYRDLRLARAIDSWDDKHLDSTGPIESSVSIQFRKQYKQRSWLSELERVCRKFEACLPSHQTYGQLRRQIGPQQARHAIRAFNWKCKYEPRPLACQRDVKRANPRLGVLLCQCDGEDLSNTYAFLGEQWVWQQQLLWMFFGAYLWENCKKASSQACHEQESKNCWKLTQIGQKEACNRVSGHQREQNAKVLQLLADLVQLVDYSTIQSIYQGGRIQAAKT